MSLNKKDEIPQAYKEFKTNYYTLWNVPRRL